MSNQKSANDYREERKARLAKASKKNAKKSHKLGGHRMSKKAKAVIAIILVVAIAGGAGYLACKSFGVFERMKTIETVGGESYPAVEYEYYYKSVHNYIYNMAYQYDNYYGAGYGYQYTGFDCSKDPAEQEYPFPDYTLEDGSKATWKQYFEYIALQNMQRYNVLIDMANEAGFKASDEAVQTAKNQVEELRTNIKEQAEQQGGQVVSLGSYLRASYGKGMSESYFMDIVERETLATEYNQHLLETMSEGYSMEELEKVYSENPSAYNCVDFRLFSIAPEAEALAETATDEEKTAANEKAAAEAKAKADAMFEAITDEASFIKLAEENATDTQKEAYDYSDPQTTLSTYVQKSTIESNFSADIINWLYGTEAKANEKKMFDVNGTYYILYMLKPSYRDNETLPVDVRHILYQVDAEAEDQEAAKTEAKAKAEAALKAINEAPDKLEKFLELCAAESEDTGSSSNGGLYEYVGKGQYVPEYEAWALDPARQEGDLGIVETDYGFHVMYFEKAYTRPYWEITISETLAAEELDEQLNAKFEENAYKVADDNAVLKEKNEVIYEELKAAYYAG